MLSYDESLKILKETDALLEGHFILSSGLHSHHYVQCAKLLSYPKRSKIICSSLSEKIIKKFNKIDIILSPAIGGIVVGYEIGVQLGIKTIFAERVNGKLVLRRGFDIPTNSNVMIVEDVITTGRSVLECLEIIKLNKSNLVGYACIIDRTNNDVSIKNEIVSQVKFKIEAFKEDNLPDNLKKIKPTKPGSRNVPTWWKKSLV